MVIDTFGKQRRVFVASLDHTIPRDGQVASLALRLLAVLGLANGAWPLEHLLSALAHNQGIPG
jgi:hypothetical protein